MIELSTARSLYVHCWFSYSRTVYKSSVSSMNSIGAQRSLEAYSRNCRSHVYRRVLRSSSGSGDCQPTVDG